jgi:CheY-like chemotaxis protein
MQAITLLPVELVLMLLATLLAGTFIGFFVRGWTDRRQGERSDRARKALRRPGVEEGSLPTTPRSVRSAAPADPSSRWAAAPPAPAHGIREEAAIGPRVLIVDDRFEFRAVNAAYLARHGYRVVEAADGDAALDAVRQVHPDAILLDHSMPNRTGLEVVRALKSDPSTAEIPIVFMTAHSYGAVGRHAMEAGCASFLPKPCDPSRILREIARHTSTPPAQA